MLKENVLCIVCQDHERCTIVVDHYSNFKDIQKMVNQRLIVRAPKTEQLYHKFEKKQRANYCLNLRKRTVRISDNSSNVNEVIRAVLNFFFFTKRFHTHKKHKTDISEQKQKRQRLYAHKKHRRDKKSLIRLFAFLGFLAFQAFCACKIFS